VAATLAREGPFDHVVVAGDHLQGGPRPQEVWDLLGRLGWTLIRGNEDEALGQVTPPESGGPYRQAYLDQHDWSRGVLPGAVLEALQALPPSWRCPTPAGDLLVVHSSPRSTRDRFGGPHNSPSEVAAAYGGTGAALIAFGHYHASFVRPAPFALLVNVASVGLPVDRRPLAAYTVLSVVDEGWVVEQRRVPYQGAAEAWAARERGLPAWVPEAP
jgi:hypothetical protein